MLTNRDTVATDAVCGVTDPRIVSNGRPADAEPDVEVEDPRDGDDAADPQVRYAITSYGADFSVDGYLNRLARGDLFIPDFQRNFVWTKAQASRFIESLILDLPVPGFLLFREPDTRKLMVVDGQQRLRSIELFRRGMLKGSPFRLTGVTHALQGRSWEDLFDVERRSLEDAIIHSTIFQQIYPSDDRTSVYEVFERLNTGGTVLQAQEVRSCVYRGPFVTLLSELNGDAHWRSLFGKKHSRKKDEEIILRFLALHDDLDRYERPMKQFLNIFMARHQNLSGSESDRMRFLFKATAEVVNRALTARSFRPKGALNVAAAESVLVGVAHRLAAGAIVDDASLRSAHAAMMESLEARHLYHGSTTHQDRLKERIRIAVRSFAAVP